MTGISNSQAPWTLEELYTILICWGMFMIPVTFFWVRGALKEWLVDRKHAEWRTLLRRQPVDQEAVKRLADAIYRLSDGKLCQPVCSFDSYCYSLGQR